MRKGIVSAGNWLVDTIKFIGTYPTAGNLVTIERIESGFGGCSHNVWLIWPTSKPTFHYTQEVAWVKMRWVMILWQELRSWASMPMECVA